MARIHKHVLTEEDLIEIWIHTFENWGEAQADKYLDDLDEVFNLLAEQPLICRERFEFNPPVRIHHHAHHLIVYTAIKGGISIVRVLHENMEIGEQLD